MAKKALTKKDVLDLARLAALELSEEEEEKYTSELTESLNYIDNLSEIDTRKVSSDFFTTDITNISRDDEVKNDAALTQKEALDNSKNKKGKYFVVKRIL